VPAGACVVAVTSPRHALLSLGALKGCRMVNQEYEFMVVEVAAVATPFISFPRSSTLVIQHNFHSHSIEIMARRTTDDLLGLLFGYATKASPAAATPNPTQTQSQRSLPSSQSLSQQPHTLSYTTNGSNGGYSNEVTSYISQQGGFEYMGEGRGSQTVSFLSSRPSSLPEDAYEADDDTSGEDMYERLAFDASPEDVLARIEAFTKYAEEEIMAGREPDIVVGDREVQHSEPVHTMAWALKLA
jgi:hypothetical protein